MKELVIATRGSELALWQANHVKSVLQARDPSLRIELLVLKTQGDIILDRPLSLVGGKALFVKEIEQALLDDRAHIAVHSMKDVPAQLAQGLTLAAITAREDPRDALLTLRSGVTFRELPAGAHVGTSSLRRQCQLLAARPDLKISSLRGNVPTRVRKLRDGQFDAIVLAAAGLHRLGFAAEIAEHLAIDLSLPAVGQGTLAIETREIDHDTTARVRAALHDEGNAQATIAERSFLSALGGGCQTPLAGHAVVVDKRLYMRGLVGEPDGTVILQDALAGDLGAAEDLGQELATRLLARGARDIIARCVAANPIR